MVIWVVPVPVILESVTAMASIVESSDVFLMVTLPLSRSTAWSNVRTILASTATAVALSAGAEEERVGAGHAVAPPSLIVQLSFDKILALAVAAAEQPVYFAEV